MSTTPERILQNVVELPKYEAGSAQWLEARRNAIGGSEIAAVIEVSPYKTKSELWHEKKWPHLVEPRDSPQMEWGRLTEPIVAQLYSNYLTKRGIDHEVLDPEYMYQSKAYPFVMAEPDRLIRSGDELWILEIKTASGMTRASWGHTDAGVEGIPEHYQTQVMWYMACLGLDRADLAVVIDNGELRVYECHANEADIQELIVEAEKFIKSLEKDDPPPFTYRKSEYQFLRRLHPDIEPGKTVEAHPDLAARLHDTDKALKFADTLAQQAKNEAMQLMGNAEHLLGPGGEIIATRTSRAGGRPYLRLKGND